MYYNTKRISTTLLSLFSLPPGKIFLISLLCWLLSFAYCKQRYWRDPHSAFFNSDHVYDLKYSALRTTQANAFVDTFSQPDVVAKKASAKPEICAAFVTVPRNGNDYMVQAIGSMLDGLAEEERSNLFVYVLFASTVPTLHPIWNATWLRNATDLVGTYDVTAETLAHLHELEEQRNFYEKGVFDYVYALDVCYNTGAPYIAMLEDDIIFADGWLAKTRDALHKIEPHATEGKKYWNWLYLRLFYTETALQWEPEDFWYANIYFTFLLAAFIGYLLLIGIRFSIPSTRKFLNHYAIGVICVITIPAFTALLFMIGKYSLFPPDAVFTLNKHGCCTQAMVFPRGEVPQIIQYLRERKGGQTDTLLEEYADSEGKERLALGQQVVQHIGLVSSRDNTEINTRSVWAFWFEENNPMKLRREHEELLRG